MRSTIADVDAADQENSKRRTTPSLPAYAAENAAFHRAFAAELKAIIAALPVGRHMRVLDAGCGDGFYMSLLAGRLNYPGGITGLDVNAEYLNLARTRVAESNPHCNADFVIGDLYRLPARQPKFDFVWCAQSLYSLPDPVGALKQMARSLKPDGMVAVLENDTMHQVLLPWPSDLEIALRAAELAALADKSRQPDKFYIGRRLPAVLAEAGLQPLGYRTQCIDRQAPLNDDLNDFLRAYLLRLAKHATPYLDKSTANEFARLIDDENDAYLLRQPQFTMSWLNVLAWGRRPAP